MSKTDPKENIGRGWAVTGFAIGLLGLVAAVAFVWIETARIDRTVVGLMQTEQELRASYAALQAEYSDTLRALDNANRAMSDASTAFAAEVDGTRDADQLVARMTAWSVLTSGTAGDLGKSAAFEYLADQGEAFQHLDLSCPAFGADETRCLAPVRIDRLRLSDAYLDHIDFRHAQFVLLMMTGGTLNDASMDYSLFRSIRLNETRVLDVMARGARWYDVDVTGGTIQRSDFTGARMGSGRWSDVRISDTVFDNALVEYVQFDDVRFSGVSFRGAGLSGTRFENMRGFEDVDLTDVWAWSDQMPVGIDPDLVAQCVFPADRIEGSSPVRGERRPADC